MEEIKAGDIMLNNWVEYDGKYYQISALSEEYPFLNTDAFGVGVVTYRNIKGIPLTEDILLKAGFRKRKMSGYDTHFIYSLFIGGETICITAIYNADFSIMLHGVARGVKYLHRLQNIIKIITGNELEINL